MANPLGNPEDIEFPQTLSVRVIMEEVQGEKVNRSIIEQYLLSQGHVGVYEGRKPTSAGTYASYAYRVEFQNYPSMKEFYLGLKKIPGVKTAL
jgi:putative lipoic acid-binding regulatory protein